MTKKIALITGGAGDIGTAICRQLADMQMQVIAADKIVNSEAHDWLGQQREDGYSHIDLVHLDVTDAQACIECADEIKKRFGVVNVLVNNAGIIRDSMFRKMTHAQWRAVLDVNLTGMFNVAHAFIEGMIEQGFGRMVNISSVSAQIGQIGQANYSAAKAGVHGFTKTLARELGKYGITVNSISPGFIQTRMTASIPDKVKQIIIDDTPVRRFGHPEEIAWTVAFLTDQRSGFINGANLSVNGGQHLY